MKQKRRGVLELGSWGTGLLIGSIMQASQYHPANPIYRRLQVKKKSATKHSEGKGIKEERHQKEISISELRFFFKISQIIIK